MSRVKWEFGKYWRKGAVPIESLAPDDYVSPDVGDEPEPKVWWLDSGALESVTFETKHRPESWEDVRRFVQAFYDDAGQPVTFIGHDPDTIKRLDENPLLERA